MAVTYNPEDPTATALSYTRMLIGDVPPRALLQDGEINATLAIYNNTPLNAAIRCCELMMARVSSLVNESVGAKRMDLSNRSKQLRELRADLVRRLATEDAQPYAGGLSISDKLTVESNSDRVRPDFTKHMMQNQNESPWSSYSWNGWPWGGQA